MRLLHLLHTSSGHIRSRLFRDLVLLVLLTVGLLVAVNWLLIGELKREFAAAQISTATALVRDEVRNLLGPVEQQLLITRDSLQTARLTPSDRAALDERFVPTMRHMDQIAGAIFADETGAEYFLRPDGGDWLTRLRSPGEPGSATWARWSPEGAELKTWEGTLEYDPRRRPWFTGAKDAIGGPVSWSAPYVFHSLKIPGVTASVAWKEEETLRVAALDVALSRVIDAIDRLSLSPDGRGFLFSGDGGVYVPEWTETGEAPDRTNGFFSAHERLGGPLVFDAVDAWRDGGRQADELIRFKSQGRDWWGGFLPLSSTADAAWVGVALPVHETLGVLQNRWQIVALTAVIIMLFAVGLVLMLMRKYSRQLRDLPKLSINRRNHEQDIYDLIGNGEDTHLELKSTMRTNLHTHKPGKEIELAWLKGVTAFMNTEGGILLMGVADDGTVLGLEEDRFENEDRCRLHFKNLLNQHLGPEYARFVRFEVYELEGKQVGAVECERADAPVFLRNKSS
ncbi:MAG: putative DNA binding domain-containing protein, partial [Pseudomonadota bacterium]|nr:putative DNA binding domain-containing protein [Pseudomonadota bacterium]